MKHETDYTTPRAIVRDLAPGRYTLKEMYADQWLDVRRPRACGRWFRRAVRDDRFPRVSWLGRRSNRSYEYLVRPAAEGGVSLPARLLVDGANIALDLAPAVHRVS